ncbi:MAG TPA: hypothetical protein VD866_13475 [Urbifossiella sp.]|nr:hypothetical protein [Urbifossiella sp.]
MSRRKRDDTASGGAAVADPPGEPTPPGEAAEPAAPQTAAPRPAANFAAMSDRTTRIEVAVWARQVTAAGGEEYTQHSLTVCRSWRDGEGTWAGNGSYRAHDVPVLLSLVTQAYHWCVTQRTTVRDGTDGDLPF